MGYPDPYFGLCAFLGRSFGVLGIRTDEACGSRFMVGPSRVGGGWEGCRVVSVATCTLVVLPVLRR